MYWSDFNIVLKIEETDDKLFVSVSHDNTRLTDRNILIFIRVPGNGTDVSRM